jgi:hypothetical protein
LGYGLNEWWAIPNVEKAIIRYAQNGLVSERKAVDYQVQRIVVVAF